MIRPKKAFPPRPRTKPGSSGYYRELRLNLRRTIANIPIPESAIEKPGFSGHQK
ncbi:hypothetical protein [Pedobacter psychrodurus]|uniref:hypothetical protein n=1 Tax=Pedobacter psychrodurus TaxID=2530456 RepID=UPI0029314BD0|nr:hypothetical protein [Pedobacter psychrodurus]